MHCPQCLSPHNIIVRSRKSNNDVIRIRECQECQTIWSTSEPAKALCECGRNDWIISRVEHSGADSKMRLRTCRQCKKTQHTIERKITGNKQNQIKFIKAG